MRKILLLLIVIFSLNQTKAQTKQDALNALRAKGVTLEQAQKLALANGLLPDTKSSKSGGYLEPFVFIINLMILLLI